MGAWPAFVIAVVVLAAPETERSTSVECRDRYASCKEDCTLSFGVSLKLREKFGACTQRCLNALDACRANPPEQEPKRAPEVRDDGRVQATGDADAGVVPEKRNRDIPVF